MAKHKKINKKKEKDLEQLAAMLKSSAKKHDEEDSEAGKELDKSLTLTNLDLKDMEFHQQIEIEEDSSVPVLEKIVGAQPKPIFIRGFSRQENSSNDNSNDNNSKDEFKYVPGSENGEDPKYIPTSEFQGNPIERIEAENLGRRQSFIQDINPERFSGMYDKTFQSSNIEGSPERLRRFDTENTGRKNPFEKEDRRYKPKLPKL
jgi:hypothetical protein